MTMMGGWWWDGDRDAGRGCIQYVSTYLIIKEKAKDCKNVYKKQVVGRGSLV